MAPPSLRKKAIPLTNQNLNHSNGHSVKFDLNTRPFPNTCHPTACGGSHNIRGSHNVKGESSHQSRSRTPSPSQKTSTSPVKNYQQNGVKNNSKSHPQSVTTRVNAKSRKPIKPTTPTSESEPPIDKKASQVHSQQSSNSIVCYNDTRTMDNAFCPINLLKSKLLKTIFSFLNHSDLVHCRAVQKRWNTLISRTEIFLDKTIFVSNMQRTYYEPTDVLVYDDILKYATLPFRHARFQYFDYLFFKEPEYFYFRNSDNEKYSPNSNFLRKLVSLEFRNSYLLWTTLKRILIKTTCLEKLTISNCHISEAEYKRPVVNEFENFSVGNTLFGLKALEISESRHLSNITRILRKLNGYENQSLESLKISFYPPGTPLERFSDAVKAESFDLCRELKTVINLSAKSLKVLIMDIQHNPTLDIIGYHLGKELVALGTILNLREFQLSPSLGVWENKPEEAPRLNTAMTMKNVDEDIQKSIKAVASALARFLETQKHIINLGLPCMEYPEAYSSCFKSVLQRLPCAKCLQCLAVPCAGFLPEDFLFKFPNLKRLKIGATCCGDDTSTWDMFRHYICEQISSPRQSDWILDDFDNNELVTKSQVLKAILKSSDRELQSSSPDLLKNVEELCISTVESPERFDLFAKYLCNLTSFEVNSGEDIAVLRDKDLQVCIKYLKNLKCFKLSCCNKLTDYGITGISSKDCSLMFKHQLYQKEGVKPNKWESEQVRGRPLSDLKGLRKLVLMGRCNFTDIGIGYGLAFNELKYCHLPYSDYITSWGIERFGRVNPSVESLVLSGVSQLSKDAFQKLKITHERMRLGDLSRSGFFTLEESQFEDNFYLILPSPSEALSTVLASVAEQIRTIVFSMVGYQKVHQLNAGDDDN